MNNVGFSHRFGLFVLKYRWPIIIANLVLFLAVLAAMINRGKEFGEHITYMKKVRENPLAVDSSHSSPPPIFNADYRVWFDSDNPDMLALDRFQMDFVKEDNLIIVLVSKSGNLFTNENLKSMKTLVDSGWTVPYVNRVDGLTNFSMTRVEGDELNVAEFVEELPLSEDELASHKKEALSDPLIPHFLISPDAKVTQISYRVVVPHDFTDGFLQARAKTVKLVDQVLAENPDLTIRLGGTVMLNNAFIDFAMRDQTTLLPIMLFVVVPLLLAFLLRSFWGTVLPLGLLIASAIFPVLLYVGVLRGYLTNISLNTVQIMVAIAIADSIHIVATFQRGMRQGMTKRDAVLYTLDKNLVACFLTSITTAIGFYSLLLQSIPPFRELGLLAGTGTLYAWEVSTFALPALMSLLPFKAKVKTTDLEKNAEVFGKLARWVFRNARMIRWVSLAVTLVSIGFMTQIKIDNNTVNYFSKRSEFRQATDYIDNNILGTNAMEFSFDSKEAEGVNNPEFLKKIDRFRDYLASHPEYNITYASGITDIIKRLNKSLHGDDPAYYTIPDKDSITAEGDTLVARNLIAQYLLLYSMSLPQGMELTNQLSIDRSKARVTAFQRTMNSFVQMAYVDSINAWLDKEMPELQARAIGVPVMFGKLMVRAIPGLLGSLAVSVLLITLCMTITFRSIKFGLMSMIPNVWPLLFVFGALGAIGYIVDLSVAVVGMITLGIAVDDTIHVLVKYLRYRREGMESLPAMEKTFQETGLALTFTSIILFAGFGILVFSQFKVNMNFGALASSIIALALFADFIILPAVFATSKKSIKGN